MEQTVKYGTLIKKCSVPGVKQMSTEQLIVQNVIHFRIGRDQLSSKVMMILRLTSIFVKKKDGARVHRFR